MVWKDIISIVAIIFWGVFVNVLTEILKGIRTKIVKAQPGRREIFKWRLISFLMTITMIIACWSVLYGYLVSQPVNILTVFFTVYIAITLYEWNKMLPTDFAFLVGSIRDLSDSK